MKMHVKQLAYAMFVAVTWLPLPAAAELLGLAKCSSPSWNALMSGECGVGGAPSESQPVQQGADSSTVLVAVENIPVDALLVPEPGTYALMLIGLTAIIALARKRRSG